MESVHSASGLCVLPFGEYYALAMLAILYTAWFVQIGLSFLVWLYRTNDYILLLDRVVELRIDQGKSRVSVMVSETLGKLLMSNEPATSVNSDPEEKVQGSRSSDDNGDIMSTRLKLLLQTAERKRESKKLGHHRKTRAVSEGGVGSGSSFKARQSRRTKTGHRVASKKTLEFPSKLTLLNQEERKGTASQVLSLLDNSENTSESQSIRRDDESIGEGEESSITSSLSKNGSISTIQVVGTAFGSRNSDSVESLSMDPGAVVCTQQPLDSCSDKSVRFKFDDPND